MAAQRGCKATTARTARAKARDELRRQRDFGHEHERAASRLGNALDEPQVHLVLAAARDAACRESLKLPEVTLQSG